MKSVLLLVAVSAFVAVSFAAQSIIPAKDGKCIYEGKELKLGKNDFEDSCHKVDCDEDGSMVDETCSPFVIDKCTPGDFVDVSQPFPQCCKKIFTCKDDQGGEITKEYNAYSD